MGGVSWGRDARRFLARGQYLPCQPMHCGEYLGDIARVASNHERVYAQVGKRLDLLHDGVRVGP